MAISAVKIRFFSTLHSATYSIAADAAAADFCFFSCRCCFQRFTCRFRAAIYARYVS